MAEYLNILVISIFSSVIFCFFIDIGIFTDFFLILYTLFFSFVFIWVRGTLPRIRYDRLISLTWKGFLPFSLGVLMIFVPLYFYMWYCAG
jgi:NADH-ubiquinone oxidoreductase chain 1